MKPAQKTLQDNQLPETDENIFIVATCKDKGLAFLKGEAELGVRKVDPASAPQPQSLPQPGQPAEYSLIVNGKEYFLAFEGNHVTVDGNVYQVTMNTAAAKSATSGATSAAKSTPIVAQMPVSSSRSWRARETRSAPAITCWCLEAMKMEVTVATPSSGTISQINVAQGDHVANGQELALIRS